MSNRCNKKSLRENKKLFGLQKIIAKCLAFCMALSIGNIMSTQCVKAELADNTVEESVENYDVHYKYYANVILQGSKTYKLTPDLSRIDEISFPYSISIQKCCDDPRVEHGAYVSMKINGIMVHYDNSPTIKEDINERFTLPHVIDVRQYRTSNSLIEYELLAYNQTCLSCGNNTRSHAHYLTVDLVDHRAKVNSMQSDVSVAVGEGCTFSPEFDENTAKIEWAVKYPGEASFTILNEGNNAKGLVASGVNSKSLAITSVPMISEGFDVGVFVYDSDGSLPGGTNADNTPFYTHVTVTDNTYPSVDIKKTIDKGSGSVIVSIIATDNCGLSEAPYSFDGGNTFVSDNSKSYTEPGKYTVAVRDSSNNTIYKDFYIDSIEIEKARPKDENSGSKVDEKEAGVIKTDPNTGTNGKEEQNKEAEKINEEIKNLIKNIGNENKEKGSFSEVKAGNKEENEDTGTVSDTVKQNNQIASSNAISSKSNSENKSNKNTSLTPKKISEKESNNTFEKIRKNSEEYIISMKESVEEKTKSAESKKPVIDLETIDDEEADDYTDEGNEDEIAYSPKTNENKTLVIIGIVLLVIILIAILAFVLFFGVIIFIEKETEYSKLTDMEGVKVPVALSIINITNGDYSVCFRELLEKYGVVYARFGALFAYMYEGDKIKIMTKFKGEKKREVATERITGEIVVGRKPGK